MSSLTTYGINRSPFVASVSFTPLQALQNYGTLTQVVVGNSAASTWGYLHLYDAASPAQVVPGTTPPRLMIPVANGQTVSPNLGTGVIFNQGVVAVAMTTVNGNVGVATPLAVSLGFNTQPTD